MSSGIRVSEKHGVNPMLVRCFVCNEETGGIALLGRLPNDAEAPRSAVLNKEPCEKCRKLMETGIIVISVRDNQPVKDRDNPYRTGGWVVVKDEFFTRIRNEKNAAIVDSIIKARMTFMEDGMWDKLGFPERPKLS